MFRSPAKKRTRLRLDRSLLVFFWLVTLSSLALAATRSPKLPVTPKWERFQASFHSSVDYTNPLQQVRLTAVFTSPLGETNQVDCFWDGGKNWRVRFSPDQPGRWTFLTICSDPTNAGLSGQTGSFLCTAPLGKGRFQQHGPVRLARDHLHLEHADGTPFFWLGDTVWNGASASTLKEWELYTFVRASQNFDAALWSVAPGVDESNESAVTGFPEEIGVNPQFFKRLDQKIETLNRAGILSAIAPLLETGFHANLTALPDEQALLLTRYVVARWGAEHVAWLFVVDGPGSQSERWKKIGQALFAGTRHAPVVVCSGARPELLEQFRNQEWVDLLSFEGIVGPAAEALKASLGGPLADQWRKEPRHPLIHQIIYENSVREGVRIKSDAVRQLAYWSVLAGTAAGLNYGGQGVLNWDVTTDAPTNTNLGATLPLWQKALFMPVAKQMGYLSKLMDTCDFWRLRPLPKAVVNQPGDSAPLHQIVAAETEERDLTLVYVPLDRSLDLSLEALPPSPQIKWFNPRTGQNNPAIAVVSGQDCQFPTPGPDDWLLIAKKGK